MLQALPPAFQRLARHAVDQIEAQIVEATYPSLPDRGNDIGPVVRPVKELKLRLLGGLRSKADPVDPGVPESSIIGWIVNGGIRLQRDFDVRRHGKCRSGGLDDAPHLNSGKHARRAATKVDRVHKGPIAGLSHPGQLVDQRVDVGWNQLLQPGIRVKRAVGAARPAKWDVKI